METARCNQIENKPETLIWSSNYSKDLKCIKKKTIELHFNTYIRNQEEPFKIFRNQIKTGIIKIKKLKTGIYRIKISSHCFDVINM